MHRLRKLTAAAAALTLAACGGDSPTGPEVTTVTVTPGSATLAVIGATQQFSAQARDADGQPVTGMTIAWSSSDAATATVSESGLVTAVAEGAAVITAEVGGATGTANVTVQSCANQTTVTLAPGGAQSFATTDCVLIPSGAAGNRYRVAVIRPTESVNASDVQTVTLYVSGVGVTSTPPPASAPALRAPAFDLPPMTAAQAQSLRRSRERVEATARFDARLRVEEEALLARLAPDAVLRTPALEAPAAPARVDSPEKMTFDTSIDPQCSTSASKKVTGIRVHENDDLVLYQDSTQRTTQPIPVGLAQELATYYSDYGKPVVENYFGTPSDIDGNGKVVVLATPLARGDTVAFVWQGDFFSKASCPASNEMELIYFNTEDILAIQDESYHALAVAAHEAKHVVSLYNRLVASRRAGTSRSHPTWIEEGTAEIAGEMSSRVAWAANGGPPVGARLEGSDFYPGNQLRVTAENYGVLLDLARTVWYLSSQPNGVVVTPEGAPEFSDVYGSGWTFMRWLGDAYGQAGTAPQADAPLFRAMNDSLAGQGTAGILEQTGKTFTTLLDEFAVAVMLHETGAPAPSRDFATYDYLSGTDIFTNPDPPGVFPWPVTTTEGDNESVSFQTAQYEGPIGSSGIRIHDLASNGTGQGAQIRLNMSLPGKMLITRLR
jgi:hypothetical protein